MEAHLVFWLLSLAMSCSGQIQIGGPPSCSCNTGREFVLLNQNKVEVVRIGSNRTIEVIVFSNGTKSTTTLELESGQAATLPINTNGTCSPVVIVSSSDIAVITSDNRGNMAAVPSVAQLRNDLVLSSPPVSINRPNQITISPLDETDIQIFSNTPLTVNDKTYSGGTIIDASIKPPANLTVQNAGIISGFQAVVYSDIVTFPGNTCQACLPYEKVLPASCFGPSNFDLGLEFNVPPSQSFLFAAKETIIRTSSMNLRTAQNLDIEQIHFYSPIRINSTAAIQFTLSQGGGEGGGSYCPVQTSVTKSSELCRKYKTFSKDDCTNKLAITCLEDICRGITIDGEPPVDIIWAPLRGTKFWTGKCSFSSGSGSHIVEHPSHSFRIQSGCSSGDKTFSSVPLCIEGSCSAAPTGPGTP